MPRISSISPWATTLTRFFRLPAGFDHVSARRHSLRADHIHLLATNTVSGITEIVGRSIDHQQYVIVSNLNLIEHRSPFIFRVSASARRRSLSSPLPTVQVISDDSSVTGTDEVDKILAFSKGGMSVTAIRAVVLTSALTVQMNVDTVGR